MKSKHTFTPATILALCALPSSALAQAAATDASARYTGPLYGIGIVLLLGIGWALCEPGWKWLGISLWFVVVMAGACLSMWALPGAAKGETWQLVALVVTLLPFLFVAERTLRSLQGR